MRNNSVMLSAIVVLSCSPYRLKNSWCASHSPMKIRKQNAKGRTPRTVSISASYVLGTSSETTISESANPKITSLNASSRDTSCERYRNGILCAMASILIVLISARMIVRAYEGKEPRFGARVFVAETAAVIGDVELGDDCSIWYSAVVRADVHSIRIGARSNIQDNCTLHVTQATHPVR